MNNNRQSNGKRGKSRAALFIKVFGISFVAAATLLTAGFLALRAWVRPPEIPSIANLPVYSEPGGDASAAYLTPQADIGDAPTGADKAPEGFTTRDRKELFYTFVVFGLDEGVNTDTIMVASYDGKLGEANIISIPRDTKVSVRRNVKKINSAYPAGTLNGGGREGGVAQLKHEIRTIVGFEPDFYVAINLKAFERVIDALGGVEVYVDMNMVYDDPAQNFHVNLAKGAQTLSGADALRYARYRKGNNDGPTPSITDFKRIEHQQAIIKAVLKKLLSPSSLVKIPEFIDIFNKNVFTDLAPENLLWFAEQLNALRGEDALHTYTMPISGGSGEPMYYEYVDKAAALELVNRVLNPYAKSIEAKDVTIAGEND